MSNAQELANECADLGGLAGKVFQVDSPEYETASATGRVRYAVEVECERRGQSYNFAWFPGHRPQYNAHTGPGRVSSFWANSHLEAALLLLKWLLENPTEEES